MGDAGCDEVLALSGEDIHRRIRIWITTGQAEAASARGYEYICLVVFRVHEACLVGFENKEISGACIVHLRISFRSCGNPHCVDIV